jgi:1-acyl-sn-glycerol-3-phosphate acyltransferase
MERWILGLRYVVQGTEHLPTNGGYIVAAKHQSAYETLKLPLLFARPVVVVKHELLQIPFWGWYAAKAGMIGIRRGRPREAMPQMIAGVRAALALGRTVVIFPQGTRVAVTDTPVDKPYKRGIYQLYRETGATVVPLALNSGLFWSRNAIIKRGGVVTFQFLAPLPPGLPEEAFMAQLETVALAEAASTAPLVPRTYRTLNWIFGILAGMIILYTAAWFGGAAIIAQQLADTWARPGPGISLSNPPPRLTGFPGPYRATWSGSIQSRDTTLHLPDLQIIFWPIPGTDLQIDIPQGLRMQSPRLRQVPGETVTIDQFGATVQIPWVFPPVWTKAEVQKLHDQQVIYRLPYFFIKGLRSSEQTVDVDGENGVLFYDQTLQPQGSMTVTVTGLQNIAGELTGRIKDPLARSIAKGALGSLMGQQQGQTDGTLRQTLTLRDGLAIYSIGRIYWPVTAPTAPEPRP